MEIHYWRKEEEALVLKMYKEGFDKTQIAGECNKKFWKKNNIRTERAAEAHIEKMRKKGLIGYMRNPKGHSNFKAGILSDKCRNVLELKQQGLSDTAVADRLDMPVGSVKSSLNFLRSKKIWQDGIVVRNGITDMDLEKEILATIRRHPQSVGELSRTFDRSKETIIRVMDNLRSKGYDVDIAHDTKQVTLSTSATEKFTPYVFKKLYKHSYKIGLVGDTQLGSKYSQMTLLQTCYKIFDDENVDFILHAGDLCDGTGVYKGQISETFLHDADDIKEYIITKYPVSKKGIATYIVPGNHDYSFKKLTGYNIVRDICGERKDFMYRGEGEALFDVKGLLINLIHPSGGGGYALSYRLQKITADIIANTVQSMRNISEIKRIPKLLVFGHYHKYFDFPYAGSTIVSVPGLQAQTPYLRDKGLSPDLGCVIIHLEFDDNWNLVKLVPDLRLMNHLVKEHDY